LRKGEEGYVKIITKTRFLYELAVNFL